jgi:hypothetical protein
VHGDDRVEPGAAAAPDEQRLVVEGLEVGVDGREVIAARQCSDGGLPGSPPPDCAPLPAELEGAVCWGASVPLCGD